MNIDYPVEFVPASPEYILAVIKDSYRQQCEYDHEAERGVLLSFDSSIAEWRDACNLLPWRKLGVALNDYFKTDFSEAQWKNVLQPAKEKKLIGVCELLATQAKRSEIRTFGKDCVAAGVFLTVRSMLARAGVKERIKPSTPIAPFFKNYYQLFLTDVSRIEPGALAPVKIHNPLYKSVAWACGLGVLAIAIGYFASAMLSIVGAILSAVGYVTMWEAAGHPAKAEFGTLETFRDLSLVIASARSERLSRECKS